MLSWDFGLQPFSRNGAPIKVVTIKPVETKEGSDTVRGTVLYVLCINRYFIVKTKFLLETTVPRYLRYLPMQRHA